MTKNPWVNAVTAMVYIVFVALIMFFGTRLRVGQDALIAPIAMISLFTFSAAVMGYVFLYQPFILYFEGKKKPAVDLFGKTLLIFGAITLLLMVIMFLKR